MKPLKRRMSLLCLLALSIPECASGVEPILRKEVFNAASTPVEKFGGKGFSAMTPDQYLEFFAEFSDHLNRAKAECEAAKAKTDSRGFPRLIPLPSGKVSQDNAIEVAKFLGKQKVREAKRADIQLSLERLDEETQHAMKAYKDCYIRSQTSKKTQYLESNPSIAYPELFDVFEYPLLKLSRDPDQKVIRGLPFIRNRPLESSNALNQEGSQNPSSKGSALSSELSQKSSKSASFTRRKFLDIPREPDQEEALEPEGEAEQKEAKNASSIHSPAPPSEPRQKSSKPRPFARRQLLQTSSDSDQEEVKNPSLGEQSLGLPSEQEQEAPKKLSFLRRQ